MINTDDTNLPKEEDEEPVEQDLASEGKDEWQARAEQSENKYLRILADYQNLEKRMRQERIELLQSANRDVVLKFLPILDTLVLAQQHEENKTLGIISSQFSDTLKAEGVTPLEVIGKNFDPATMEVVTTQEGKEGIVIQEVRKGYLLHDRLLRPAGVIVGNGQKKEGK